MISRRGYRDFGAGWILGSLLEGASRGPAAAVGPEVVEVAEADLEVSVVVVLVAVVQAAAGNYGINQVKFLNIIPVQKKHFIKNLFDLM